jgi:long-chain acyl-CoA synthetase
VRKGDRVALVLPNCPQAVIALFATLPLGAVVVQHNPLYTERELAHQLVDCRAEVAVVLDTSYQTLAAVRSTTALREVVVTSVLDYLPGIRRRVAPSPAPGARSARASRATRRCGASCCSTPAARPVRAAARS